MAEITITIQNQKGLHARATAKFVKIVDDYDCEMTVAKGDDVVDAGSIMGLLMLGAGIGSEITITAKGVDEEQALSDLSNLINRKFDEE